MTPLFFSWSELAQITAGSWLVAPPPPAAVGTAALAGVTAIVDDSRLVQPGALFVAIAGTNIDGHTLLTSAVAAGAAAVIVQQAPAAAIEQLLRAGAVACLQVDDSLRALQHLAAAHRQRQRQLRMVGITGSSGKTSTKEMLAAILEQVWPGAVAKTCGNTNNHFGVPRNLLQLHSEQQAAVLEIGTSGPGEIAELTRLVRPQIGVICSIGAAHLERLQSLDGVAREKAALLAGLEPEGVGVIPATSVHAPILHAALGARRYLTFGDAEDADVKVTYLGAAASGGSRLRLCWRHGVSVEFDWQLAGRHMASNAAAAAAAATALDIAPAAIAAGLGKVRLPGMRMQQLEHDGVVWINDAYNANPDSMRAALIWFAEAAESFAPVVVLGDMFELGSSCGHEHRQLLEFACEQLPQALLLAVGARMGAAAAALAVPHCPDASAARQWLYPRLRPGMRVLLKASRAMALEQLLPALSRPAQAPVVS